MSTGNRRKILHFTVGPMGTKKLFAMPGAERLEKAAALNKNRAFPLTKEGIA